MTFTFDKANRVGFVLLALVTLFPPITAPLGLALGIGWALVPGNPFPKQSAWLSGRLLKACVVGLGFGLSLPLVLESGLTGLWLTGLGVVLILGTGLVLARLMQVDPDTGRLVAAGTAICGGSAIAALAPVLRARAEAISAAIAAVFVLNAAALYLFPWLGTWLSLTQGQFAVWAAVAIHDTSSVVGAAAAFGDEALARATVYKLARALWIIPLVLVFSLLAARSAGDGFGWRSIKWPWFIGLFVLAAACRSAFPDAEPLFSALNTAARQGLVLTLFLIGAAMSRSMLTAVGWRPFSLALVLWLLTSSATLALVLVFADRLG